MRKLWLLLACAGCGKSGAKTTWLVLPEVGLTLEAPADARADHGERAREVQVLSPSLPDCAATVADANPDMLASYDRTLYYLTEGKMGYGKLKSFTRQEVAGNAWRLEWTSDTPYDHSATVYHVDHRILFPGKVVTCTRETRTPEGQACVARMCSSIKLAP
jgi:hypothetical protein